MLVEDQEEIVQEETEICTVLFASCIGNIVETLCVCVCVCVCVCTCVCARMVGKRRKRMENYH